MSKVLLAFVLRCRNLGCALLLAWVSQASATPLPAGFSAALREAGIPLSAVALSIQPVDSPRAVLALNAAQAMNPASVMKLVTTLVALDRLGPAYTWKTDFWADGQIDEGVLTGNLIIKAYGDPTLTLERMWLMQRELRGRGIHAIHGDLILDNQFFKLPALDPGAFDGEPFAVYNAVPSALLANYNATGMKLNVGGDAVGITPEIELPNLTLTSRLVLDDIPCGEWRDRIRIHAIESIKREVIFEGRYARNCGGKHWNLSVLDPAQNFDYRFRALWTESGGVITGGTRAGTAPVAVTPLLSFLSIPLTDAVRNLNKYSNNVMTRNLFLTLGASQGEPATLEKSVQVVHAWFDEKQIAAPELVLENGAGLSRFERISAATLSRMLLAAYHSPIFSEFESALPIAGVDGTLKRRFTDSPLSGRAHLKTGTLQDVRALAGYVFNRAGKRVVFVMLVNHANADRAEAAQRALLEWIYAYRPQAAKRRARK